MSIEDIGEVLAYIALFDGRDVTAGTVLAWNDVVPATISKDDALRRVRRHMQVSDRPVTPRVLMPAADAWMDPRREHETSAGAAE